MLEMAINNVEVGSEKDQSTQCAPHFHTLVLRPPVRH